MVGHGHQISLILIPATTLSKNHSYFNNPHTIKNLWAKIEVVTGTIDETILTATFQCTVLCRVLRVKLPLLKKNFHIKPSIILCDFLHLLQCYTVFMKIFASKT